MDIERKHIQSAFYKKTICSIIIIIFFIISMFVCFYSVTKYYNKHKKELSLRKKNKDNYAILFSEYKKETVKLKNKKDELAQCIQKTQKRIDYLQNQQKHCQALLIAKKEEKKHLDVLLKEKSNVEKIKSDSIDKCISLAQKEQQQKNWDKVLHIILFATDIDESSPKLIAYKKAVERDMIPCLKILTSINGKNVPSYVNISSFTNYPTDKIIEGLTYGKTYLGIAYCNYNGKTFLKRFSYTASAGLNTLELQLKELNFNLLYWT